MRIIKVLIVLLSIIILIIGCKNSETIAFKKLSEDQKAIIQQLELKNEVLNQKVTELELAEKSFNVYEEKLIFHPRLLIPKTMNIKAIKAILGEPIKVEEAISVHAPGKTITITYTNSTFIFNSNDGLETVRAYTIEDASFATNRGIAIGSTRDDVHKAYDASYYNFAEDESNLSFGEKTGMSFKLQNDKVNEFTVWFVYE